MRRCTIRYMTILMLKRTLFRKHSQLTKKKLTQYIKFTLNEQQDLSTEQFAVKDPSTQHNLSSKNFKFSKRSSN